MESRPADLPSAVTIGQTDLPYGQARAVEARGPDTNPRKFDLPAIGEPGEVYTLLQQCRYGGGADMVTVGFYLDGTLYGRATYAHLDRNPSLWQGKA